MPEKGLSIDEEDLAAARYEKSIALDSNSTHARVVRLVGAYKNILELGCATGHMSRVFGDQGCEVVGIEIDKAAAAIAATHCARIVEGDLDGLDLNAALGSQRFDVIVAADVLEHLKDPSRLLRNLKSFLTPTGYIVASVPNVAHGSVRLALLNGRFNYTETGLLDRTHLKFFTRDTLEKLFEESGYVLGHMERVEAGIQDTELGITPADVSADLIEHLSRDVDALTYQFVVTAYPLPQDGLDFIQSRFRELREELERQDQENLELREALTSRQNSVSEIRRQLADALLAAREAATQSDRAGKEQEKIIAQLQQENDDLQKALIERDSTASDLQRSELTRLSEREAALRTLLIEANDQLIQRDDLLLATRRELSIAKQASQELEQLKEILAERDVGIEFLRGELSAQRVDLELQILTARERANSESVAVNKHDEMIHSLNRIISDRDEAIAFLQQETAELERQLAATKEWAESESAAVLDRDEVILKLQESQSSLPRAAAARLLKRLRRKSDGS